MSAKIDIEERRQHLAGLKAAREAKQRQMEKYVEVALSSHSAQSPSQPPPSATTADSSQAHSPPIARISQLDVVTNVGAVDVAPSRPREVYDRAVETDPHQDAVAPGGEQEQQQQVAIGGSAAAHQRDNDDARVASIGFMGNEVHISNSKTVVQPQSRVGDKCSTGGTQKFVKTPQFLQFLSRAVHATKRQLLVSVAGHHHLLEPQTTAGRDAPVLDSSSTTVADAVPSPSLVKRATLQASLSHQDRPVVAVCFAPGTHDWVAAALSADEYCPPNETGLVVMWQTRRSGQAAQLFMCADEVKCIAFHRALDSLFLVGGTSAGTVVCWHTLRGSNPISVSYSSPDTHSTAILAAAITGHGDSAQLTTVCREGRICTWQPENPRQPISTRDCFLRRSAASSAWTERREGDERIGRVVSAAAISSNAQDGNRLLLGNVDGMVYEVESRNSQSRSLQLHLVTKADTQHIGGPVLNVSTHPQHNDARVAALFATVSTDSSVRVWAAGAASVDVDAAGGEFVADAAWNPVHPAILATLDRAGHVRLWNVSTSVAQPVASVALRNTQRLGAIRSPETAEGALATVGGIAFTTLRWDDDGEYLAVGTTRGSVAVLAACALEEFQSIEQSGRVLSDWVSQISAGT